MLICADRNRIHSQIFLEKAERQHQFLRLHPQKERIVTPFFKKQLSVKAADSKLHVCTGIVSYSSDVYVEVDPCCENSICRFYV